MSGPVRNNTALGRFEQDLEGGVAFTTYRLSPRAITILRDSGLDETKRTKTDGSDPSITRQHQVSF